MSRLLISLCWAVLLASCHDAPRNNPFDPALTPAVELQVALDDTAGTAILTWTRYEGQQPFREYQVLRKQPGLEQVDTLVHISAVEQLTFVDSSLAPATDYLYRVSVVNSGGFEVPSPEEQARPLNLPVVQLLEPVFDSRTATAALKWTAYQGPRFKAYQAWRRSEELAVQVIAEKTDIADTSYVDRGLEGNTEYFYQVKVLTERGEEVPSEEQAGTFHQLLDTWDVPTVSNVSPSLIGRPVDFFVRLYAEGDRIAALQYYLLPGTGGGDALLHFFDPEGQVIETWGAPFSTFGALNFLSPFAATALDPEGRRFFTSWDFSSTTDRVISLLVGRQGSVLWRDRYTPEFPWTSLASLENTLALTAYDQAYSITREGEGTLLSSFGTAVGEIRTWEEPRGRGTRVGVCLPITRQILMGTVPRGAAPQWRDRLISPLGPRIGPREEGLLSYPLSFDVGPDGRIFVLDAGSARILVFDEGRSYITQWGRQGEFDFGTGVGRGEGGLDFGGSIAVDDEGYIYVADVNRRIQKFAP